MPQNNGKRGGPKAEDGACGFGREAAVSAEDIIQEKDENFNGERLVFGQNSGPS